MGKTLDWIKKSETVQFMKRHPITTIFIIVIGIGAPLILGLASVFSFLAVNNIETLKALIEAEATVLGFFGIIAVYGLNSISKRVDLLEKQIYDIRLEDLKNGNNKLETSQVFRDYCTKKDKIEEAKKRFSNIAIWAGFVLIVSLATSIGGMGFASLPESIPNRLEMAFTLTTFAILGFFSCVGLILSMIYDSARNIEELYDIK